MGWARCGGGGWFGCGELGPPVELADLFSLQARRRVEDRFAAVFDNDVFVGVYDRLKREVHLFERTAAGWVDRGTLPVTGLVAHPINTAATKKNEVIVRTIVVLF